MSPVIVPQVGHGVTVGGTAVGLIAGPAHPSARDNSAMIAL
jgi:hypothetical protein